MLNKPKLSIVVPVFVNVQSAVEDAQQTIQAFVDIGEIFEGQVEIILVDDSSTPDFDIFHTVQSPYTKVMKTRSSRVWSQPLARNLGMQAAAGEKILVMDFDHIPTPELIIEILYRPIFPGEIGRFKRMNDGEEQSNPSAFLCDTSNLPFFDERFCGNYGLDDTWWKWYWKDRPVYTYSGKLVVIPGGSRHNLERDTFANERLYNKFLDELQKGEYQLEYTKYEPEVK